MRGLLALVLVASLAGCASSAPASESVPDEVEPAEDGPEEAPEDVASDAAADGALPEAAAPGPIVHYVNASATAIATSAAVCVTQNGCEVGHVFVFERPEGTVAIVAELRWDATADLDLVLAADAGGFPDSVLAPRPSAGDSDGLPGSPDSVARAEMTDPAALAEHAAWDAIVSGKAAVDVAFELRVSIFATAPPADYTAFTEERPGPRAP